MKTILAIKKDSNNEFLWKRADHDALWIKAWDWLEQNSKVIEKRGKWSSVDGGWGRWKEVCVEENPQRACISANEEIRTKEGNRPDGENREPPCNIIHGCIWGFQIYHH